MTENRHVPHVPQQAVPEPCTARAYDLGCKCTMTPLYPDCKSNGEVIIEEHCPLHDSYPKGVVGGFANPPIVTIPRAQYEALMAARVFVDRVANYDWSHYGDRGGLKEQQKEAASVDAALRASGIEMESK